MTDPASATPTAAALIIGNEILSGKTVDENSPFLAKELRELGLDLTTIHVVRDEIDVIATAVRALAATHDHVFTSGGVGPTHDDVTLQAIARAFDRPLVRNPEMVDLVQKFYGSAATDAALRMADLPQGVELHRSDVHRVPTVIVENVYILPGIPGLFRKKILGLRDRLRSIPFTLEELYLNVDEAIVADLLSTIDQSYPEVEIGSYPIVGEQVRRVKITIESRDPTAVTNATTELRKKLPPGTIA